MKSHQLEISHWLERVGKERDIHLRLEEDGHCIIPCADGLNCIVEVPSDLEVPAVFIYLPLIQLVGDPVAQLTLSRIALEMNLFGLLTGGCQIALDARSNYLVLSFSAMIDAIKDIEFQHMINDMIELAPRLRQRLESVSE